MPDSPSDSSRHAKPSLPKRRPEGEKPRGFSDQTAEPILAPPPAGGSLAPPSPELLANRAKATLPRERNRERQLPSLTPAPYQAEPGTGSMPSVRAELPSRRSADEVSRLRPPHPPADDLPEADEADAADAAAAAVAFATSTAEVDAAAPPGPRHANHRLGASRRLEMKRQGTVDFDPEVADSWGKEKEDPETSRRGGRRFIGWAAAIAVPLVGFVVWQSLGRPGLGASDTIAQPEAATGSGIDSAEESRRAGELVSRFLATTTVEERAALVRHPEITKPRLAAWHSPANPLKPLAVLEFDDRSSEQTIDGVTFVMLSMALDDFTRRAIAVERQADGGFLVDWESFVFWSEVKWPEFLSREPAGTHEFRVAVEIDTYFNCGYEDPQKWFCYKLTDPENWAHCWGYCSLDSEAGMKINRMIRRQRQQGQNQIKTILRLKFDEAGRGRNQVLIEDVVQDGWVKPGA